MTGDTETILVQSSTPALAEASDLTKLSLQPDSEAGEFPPGKVECRIIAYLLRGVQINLYDWASMRLGRESPEGTAFKAEIRRIMRAVRKQCYDIVYDTVQDDGRPDGRLTPEEVVSIIRYVIPEDSREGGIFWTRFIDLLNYTFGPDAAVARRIFVDNTREEFIRRLPQLVRTYEDHWDGAVDHLRQQQEVEDEEDTV